jgi:hypothetical protein
MCPLNGRWSVSENSGRGRAFCRAAPVADDLKQSLSRDTVGLQFDRLSWRICPRSVWRLEICQRVDGAGVIAKPISVAADAPVLRFELVDRHPNAALWGQLRKYPRWRRHGRSQQRRWRRAAPAARSARPSRSNRGAVGWRRHNLKRKPAPQ